METLRRSASLASALLALTVQASVAAPLNPSAIPSVPADKKITYLCIFAPQPGRCDSEYRKALHDPSAEASSVRDSYEHYARYLSGANELTDADRRYLKANQIEPPDDLNAVQTSGLHNVINDAALQKNAEDRKAAVTNYLLRAEEANIYCGTATCSAPSAS